MGVGHNDPWHVKKKLPPCSFMGSLPFLPTLFTPSQLHLEVHVVEASKGDGHQLALGMPRSRDTGLARSPCGVAGGWPAMVGTGCSFSSLVY